MGLSKAKGNMYGWVSHCHTHIAGECPHRCRYCYVQAAEKRFGGGRYAGAPRLDEAALLVRYGERKRIFIEHCADLFAEGVPDEWIERVLRHCREWPGCSYVFQSRNPARMLLWRHRMPRERILGTTIETTMPLLEYRRYSLAPPPCERVRPMRELRMSGERVYVTAEPLLRCDAETLAGWVREIAPEFVNIGADSKRTPGLPEPTREEARRLCVMLREASPELVVKENFGRLVL